MVCLSNIIIIIIIAEGVPRKGAGSTRTRKTVAFSPIKRIAGSCRQTRGRKSIFALGNFSVYRRDGTDMIADGAL